MTELIVSTFKTMKKLILSFFFNTLLFASIDGKHITKKVIIQH